VHSLSLIHICTDATAFNASLDALAAAAIAAKVTVS